MKFIRDYFKIEERKSTIRTEFIGGLTTFLAMAYILFVNANILSTTGMSWGAVFTATAIAAIVGSLVMGLVANYPVSLAPGMGLNAFFAFTICAPWAMGFSWQLGLAAVFVSGLVFLALSLSGIREKIINAIPNDLKYAVGGGIGLFIAYVGLKGSGLISFIIDDPTDIVPELGTLENATLLALVGFVITVILYVRKVKGSIFLGIVCTSIIGMIFGIVDLPSGSIVGVPDAPHFGAFLTGFGELKLSMLSNFAFAVFALLFVDFFDTAGTLVSVGRSAGLVDEDGNLKDSSKALLADSTATVVGAIVGTSNTTSYIESLTGIEEGARTGLAPVFTAMFFLIFMFFSPLLSVVTPAVTAPALIMVGILMSSQLKEIEWNKIEIAIPAFITIAIMPLTYSIANGIAFGFVLYTITMTVKKDREKLSPMMYILSALFILYYVLKTII